MAKENMPRINKLLSTLVPCAVLLSATGNQLHATDQFAVTAMQSGYSVTDRGPNDKVWSRITYVTNGTDVISQTNAAFVEVATGMHYPTTDGWAESKDAIELSPDGGAHALEGPYRAYFTASLLDPEPIKLISAEGQKLSLKPFSLYYHDLSTDRAVKLGDVKDCVGELLPPNQVVWRDAFDNVRADVRVTYKKGGFELDVILMEQLPLTPEECGLDSLATSLEVWHQWKSSSEPRVSALNRAVGPGGREVQDKQIALSDWAFLPGRAFPASQQRQANDPIPAKLTSLSHDDSNDVPVYRDWRRVGKNGAVLVDSVPMSFAKETLETLPKSNRRDYDSEPLSYEVALARPAKSTAARAPRSIKLRSEPYSFSGLVIDPTITVSGTYSANFQFASGTTYWVTDDCYFSGMVRFEAGAVLKQEPYASIDLDAYFIFAGSADNNTIITSKDDDLYGALIPGSTHSPSPRCGGLYVRGSDNTNRVTIDDVTIRWAQRAILVHPNRFHCVITNVSVQWCDVDVAFLGPNGSISGERCQVPLPYSGGKGALVDVCTGYGNNSIEDAWEYRYFGQCRPADEDFDGDCLTNLQEFGGWNDPARLPNITTPLPSEILTDVGAPLTLTVGTGTPCLGTWYKSGVGTLGGTGASLVFSSLVASDEAAYTVSLQAPFNSQIPPVQSVCTVRVLESLERTCFNYLMQNTNGRTTDLFTQSQHTHPAGYPSQAPSMTWNTNSLLYGYSGFDAISTCSEWGCVPGSLESQIPVTALTARHGYMRGHGVTPTALTNRFLFFFGAGGGVERVWVKGATTRYGGGYDYTILLFDHSLTNVTPMKVANAPLHCDWPWHPLFRTCQHRIVQSTFPPFNTHPQHDGGDSGSPWMLASPYGLLFIGGTTTTGPCQQMQDDMDALSTAHGLTPALYQMQWVQ